MGLFSSVFHHQKPDTHAEPLDIVTYVASLASVPQKVDPILDPVRRISATLKPGQPLSPADSQQLGQVYLKLKTYLTHDEPLRHFTQKSCAPRFEQNLNLHPVLRFWDRPPETSAT